MQIKIKRLTERQRAFLEYVRNIHNYLGARHLIENVLKNGNYDSEDRIRLQSVIHNFKGLLLELKNRKTDGEYWCTIKTYNKPTRYLNG